MTNLAHTIPVDTSWLIGIAGRAGHGKDTIGATLADYGYQRVAFADKVREAALAINPRIIDARPKHGGSTLFWFLRDLVETEGWNEAKQVLEVRQILQRIGTEMGRNVLGEDVWIEALWPTVAQYDRVAITDVRFQNEVNAIRFAGGAVWFVDRPGYGNESDHVSEQLKPEVCDLTIVNDGTVDDLRKKVERIVSGAEI